MEWGLISELDGQTIIGCLDTVMNNCKDETICSFEVGLNEGKTSTCINEYIISNNRKNFHWGIDNLQDGASWKQDIKFSIITGDSVECSAGLKDNIFHFGFIDANHSFHRVIADFVAYAPKIKVGGILAFHDTNPAIKPFKDYQQVGNPKDERMYIQVRKALSAIGLFDNAFPEWELFYDQWDIDNEASGITAFKKIA